MKWLVRQGDTDGETIGEVEAETQDEALVKAFDKYKPGWRDDPTFNDDPWDYIYVREAVYRKPAESTIKTTKLECFIPLQKEWWEEQTEDMTCLTQLYEVSIDSRAFWFGVMQISLNVPQDRPLMMPNDIGFRVEFSDKRIGFAHMRRLKVRGDYVEVEFIGLSSLELPKKNVE
jgi:hypothetical protein